MQDHDAQAPTSIHDHDRIERLAGLARAWGDAYCFHPALTVPDTGWEARFVAAIPAVEAAQSADAYAAALNDALLRYLEDPYTFAVVAATVDPTEPATTVDAVRLPSGFGYLRAPAAGPDLLMELGRALADLAEAPGLILDLRWPDAPRSDPWPANVWPTAFPPGGFIYRGCSQGPDLTVSCDAAGLSYPRAFDKVRDDTTGDALDPILELLDQIIAQGTAMTP